MNLSDDVKQQPGVGMDGGTRANLRHYRRSRQHLELGRTTKGTGPRDQIRLNKIPPQSVHAR